MSAKAIEAHIARFSDSTFLFIIKDNFSSDRSKISLLNPFASEPSARINFLLKS